LDDERDAWRAQRDALRAESARRFHPDRALAGHAAVLRDAARALVTRR
jgi:hypothetical protein